MAGWIDGLKISSPLAFATKAGWSHGLNKRVPRYIRYSVYLATTYHLLYCSYYKGWKRGLQSEAWRKSLPAGAASPSCR
jgi:hypothetical protein